MFCRRKRHTNSSDRIGCKSMKKTIGFTFDLKKEHELEAGMPDDALAELDVEETTEEVARAIESG